MSRLEIVLLGTPQIRLDGIPVKTDRRKAVALLAYLAVSGRQQARDTLAAMFWPDYDRESALAYLRRTLWELNQMLGKGWITADREQVRLAQDGGFWLDTAQFERLACPDGSAQKPEQLEEAIGLYRADFMAGFTLADTAPFDDWQTRQSEYFLRLFASAVEGLAAARAGAGEYESALPHARRWLALDSLNEAAHRAVMRLLAGMGDRTGAIRQYETCARLLKDELGIAPLPETNALYQAILQGEITEKKEPAVARPPAAARTAPSLPEISTPFIGRRPEVERVKTLLADPGHRLFTLIGPGGTGKTRLSIQAASEMGEAFPDGVFFTPLGNVQSLDAVVPGIAKSIGFSFYREKESHRQQLIDYLHEKRLLLVLDNFEHLLGAAGLLAEILADAPAVNLLVTSRVRLNLQGEQLYRVSGMRIPDAAEVESWEDLEEEARPFSAIQLFLDRARLVQPEFRLSRENVQSVMEICRLVGGMPLGLELAAAWLELLPPEQVVAEINCSLDFLGTDQVDVPDRQSSLRAVFESSWKLLSKAEQDAFLRLCVFLGSFSREAAQQVSDVDLRTLLGLTNKSFLQQTDGGRLQLHELLRQYGEERLQADEHAWQEAKNCHTDYYAGFVASQSQRMQGPEQPAALKALEREMESNIKAAWDWLTAQQRWEEMIERMALGLLHFGVVCWRTAELVPWFHEPRMALMSPADDQEQLAFAVLSTLEIYCEEAGGVKDANPVERLGKVWNLVKELALDEAMGFWFVLLAGMIKTRNIDPESDERLEKAVARLRAGDLWQLGFGLIIQSNWWSQYDLDEDKLLEAQQIFKDLGVIYEQGVVVELLGKQAFQRKRPAAEIMGYFQQARNLQEKLGDRSYTVFNWMFLAGIYFQLGEIEQGFALLHQQQDAFKKLGNIRLLEVALGWEGLYAVRYGQFDHALDVRQRTLKLAEKVGNQADLSWAVYELGEVYRIFGQPEKGLDYYEQAYMNFEKMGDLLGLGYCQRARGDLALEQERYQDALECYRKYLKYAVQDNHLWSIGQAHARVGLAYAYLGTTAESRSEISHALTDIYAGGEYDLVLQVLLAEPVCLSQEGRLEGAVELASFIASQTISWNETKQQARTIQESVSRGLPEETVHAAIARGKRLDLDAVAASLTARSPASKQSQP